jgi:hypothetical protein
MILYYKLLFMVGKYINIFLCHACIIIFIHVLPIFLGGGIIFCVSPIKEKV